MKTLLIIALFLGGCSTIRCGFMITDNPHADAVCQEVE